MHKLCAYLIVTVTRNSNKVKLSSAAGFWRLTVPEKMWW